MASTGRLSKVLRSVFLFPQIISVVVVAVIWQFIYNPSHGLLNATIGVFQGGSPKTGWISQSNTALLAVTVAFIWWALGFYVMLFTAGLQSIPSEVTEAAELDGATGWNRFCKVTWPMLWSIKRISAIYLLSNVLNVFALVFVMTQGGPDNATQTMLTFLYQTGFEQSHYGRASALAACNFVLALGLSGVLFFITRRNPEAAR
jgi:N-acetylglucosamine transport system permease protein